ncbi:hypothetical protein [Marinomonas pollencensis]|uniref:Uncharacterized protein n=1 Tax=Marinomonas pollencensis TaxID=491954 RepID=A0A3E0DMP8_9GAMM|nr:hypothetical protein [Marinomonas pollencensis]REG83345.1 hypothetical protein DFP81_106206 [Marinomonas pollencensis]
MFQPEQSKTKMDTFTHDGLAVLSTREFVDIFAWTWLTQIANVHTPHL